MNTKCAGFPLACGGRRRQSLALLLLIVLGASMVAAEQGSKQRRGTRQNGSNQSEVFRTEVPTPPVGIVLGRPTANSVTVSVLSDRSREARVVYSLRERHYARETPLRQLEQSEPVEFQLSGLPPGTRCYYELQYRDAEAGPLHSVGPYSFHTQRPPGSPFTFTVQADSHLDENTDPQVYRATLANAAADQPDFHIDLGDTFMTDKLVRAGIDPSAMYLAQRHYFGLLCHSVPLFLVLGNHDGENGDPGGQAVQFRTKYFPNPFPDGFYTGNAEQVAPVTFEENYYAWEWGDALFVALDPFTYTNRQRGGRGDGWEWTLGEKQYRWLQQTLEGSRARHKFVFIHHLVGGLDKDSRGGVEAAKNFEWGGCNLEGKNEFQEKRPSWEAPIHELLVRTHVSAVFHGHDHFFAKQDLDGIVYQLLPQPSHRGQGAVRSAEAYGYRQGTILPGSGYLRVRVTPGSATVEFVRTSSSGSEVAHSYTIDAPRVWR